MMSRLSVLFLLCATSAGAQIVAAGAPVAEWRLGEGRGTAVEDSSGGGNNGRSHAVEWVGLPVGHALRLDGFRSYVDMQVEHLAEPPVTEEDDLATLQAAAAQAAEARGAQPPSVVIPEVETAAPEPAPAGSTDG